MGEYRRVRMKQGLFSDEIRVLLGASGESILGRAVAQSGGATSFATTLWRGPKGKVRKWGGEECEDRKNAMASGREKNGWEGRGGEGARQRKDPAKLMSALPNTIKGRSRQAELRRRSEAVTQFGENNTKKKKGKRAGRRGAPFQKILPLRTQDHFGPGERYPPYKISRYRHEPSLEDSISW